MITWLIDRTISLANYRHKQLAEENERLRARVAELEAENAELRARVPSEPEGELSKEAADLLVYLFRARADAKGVSTIARNLEKEPSEAQYYLDRLYERGLASMDHGGATWAGGALRWNLTAKGRQYVMENELHLPQE